MAFLAFPSSAILVEGISRLYRVETRRTHKNPLTAFPSAHSIQRIAHGFASAARFDANTFNFDHRHQLLVEVLTTLALRTEPSNGCAFACMGEFSFVLGDSSVRTLTPHLERAIAHRLSHQLDDLSWRKSELLTNCIKARAILPSHHDDPVNVGRSKTFTFHD